MFLAGIFDLLSGLSPIFLSIITFVSVIALLFLFWGLMTLVHRSVIKHDNKKRKNVSEAQRRSSIYEMLYEHKAMTYEELEENFYCYALTLKKDLKSLEEEGVIEKVDGKYKIAKKK